MANNTEQISISVLEHDKYYREKNTAGRWTKILEEDGPGSSLKQTLNNLKEMGNHQLEGKSLHKNVTVAHLTKIGFFSSFILALIYSIKGGIAT